MKLEIVARLYRIVEKARTGMPAVGIETLLDAVDEIEELRDEIVKLKARTFRDFEIQELTKESSTPLQMAGKETSVII